MNSMRFKTNKADIRVLYPDGCRYRAVTLPNVPAAYDAKKFARWLIKTGESILEAATTEGHHAEKESERE